MGDDRNPSLHESPFAQQTKDDTMSSLQAATVAAQAASEAEAARVGPTPGGTTKNNTSGDHARRGEFLNDPHMTSDEAAMRLDNLRRIDEAYERDEIEPNVTPRQRQGVRSFTFRSHSQPSTPIRGDPVERQEAPRLDRLSVQGLEGAQIISISAENPLTDAPPSENIPPLVGGQIVMPVTAHNARSRGRGGSSRSRRGSRGAGVRAARRKSSGTKGNVTEGWKIDSQATEEVALDDDLMERFFTQHTRLFMNSAMERLRVELEAKRLQPTRVGIIVLFCDQLLMSCVHWMNELIVLKRVNDVSVTRALIYEYLAVLLYSHCTGFSFDKTLAILTRYSGRKLNESTLKFIHGNILAYSPVGRGRDSSMVWNAQRDQSVLLGQFERRSFDVSSRVFLVPDHTICSLDDDLMGTRATDNQLKTISHRMADREGHSVDVISDAFFRIVLQARFHRRGEPRIHGVRKLFSSLLETRGQQCLKGIVVALDRGYARQEVFEELLSHGLSFIAIIPDRYSNCHPFVAKSALKPSVDNAGDEEWEENLEGEENDAGTLSTNETVLYDRPRAFVIDDNAKMGPMRQSATKKRRGRSGTNTQIQAIAVREYGTKTTAKVLRFTHCLPAPLNGSLAYWCAIPYERNFNAYLFRRRDDLGRIVTPSDDPMNLRNSVETHLLKNTLVLTTGQRCADWFTLRQLRITATEASKIYMKSNEMRKSLGYDAKDVSEDSSAEIVSRLCKAWFSTTRSSEAMMRVNKLLLNEEFREGIDILCLVEIKTSVSASSLNRICRLASADLIVREFGSEVFTDYIPEEHAGQLLHQVITTRIPNVIYVAASETQIKYVVLAMCDLSIAKDAQTFIVDKTSPFMKWTTEPSKVLPDVVVPEDRELIRSRLYFWTALNEYVQKKGPLLPIRVFRHSVQTIYSKTRGGVGGSSQYRATLRCASSSPKWEQKLFSYVLKSVTINSFIAWRMFSKESLLESRQAFQSLDYYRRKLNEVQSLADYTHEAVLEILDFANNLRQEDMQEESDEQEATFTPDDVTRLRAMAKSRKRNRLQFFNTEEMSKLRLLVKNHQHIYAGKELYCALCGQNRDESFRGHRTVIKCLFCDAHLCVKVHQGFRKSCFDVWHSARKLVPRTPVPAGTLSVEEGQDGEEMLIDEGREEARHSNSGHKRRRRMTENT